MLFQQSDWANVFERQNMYLAWREKKCCWFRQALMRHFLKCFEVFRQKALRPKLTQAEGFILGVGAKMFTIAGPVIVYGVSASVVYGLIYWITTIF